MAAKAKKLPSGNWRTQVFDYVDDSGKKHYKSFTAETKKESELMAAQYSINKEHQTPISEITVSQCMTRYIDAKENVLSPGTVREYRNCAKNHFTDIERIQISKLDNTTLQIWVSNISKEISPKTVRNAWGLLRSSLQMFRPEFVPQITLPAKKQTALYTPSDDDVKRLLDHVKGKELEIAILLAAFGPMRRGEICALESTDIKGNVITVSKSMILNDNKEWIVKQPKTYSSYRCIEMPDFVIERLKGIEGKIIQGTPDMITHRFQRAVKYTHLENKFRFHDLRHYSVSIMHAIGVPDEYIMKRGGWSTSYIMNSIYRDTIAPEEKKQTEKILSHFSSVPMP
jgi:integrase